MDICKKVVKFTTMPKVGGGEVVEVNVCGTDVLYMVGCSKDSLSLYTLLNGNVWNPTSLWGSLTPSQVRVVYGCFKEDVG